MMNDDKNNIDPLNQGRLLDLWQTQNDAASIWNNWKYMKANNLHMQSG